MKLKTLLITLLISVCQNICGQGVMGTQNISIDAISIIEIAPNGDIWVGFQDSGVAFYNAGSVEWNYYNTTNTPQMKSNTITSVALTGEINGVAHSVIGTSNGAVITQSTAWDTIAAVAGTFVYGVTYRPDSLWVLTSDSLRRYDSSFTQIKSYVPPRPNTSCIAKSKEQCSGFWVGTQNNGCYYTDNGTGFIFIDTSGPNKKLVNNQVNAIAVDNTCNRIFVGTKGGFSECPIGSGTPPCRNFTVDSANHPPQNDITSVVIGCQGNVWLGTRDSGIAVFSPQTGQFTRITTTDGLPSNNIRALAVTLDCEIYAGSEDGNVTQLDSNKNVVAILSSVRNTKRDDFKITVFPQPAKDQITFSAATEIKRGGFTLMDISGRILQQIALNHTTHFTANVSSLPQGIYFYRIVSDGQVVKTDKLEIVR